MIASPNFQAFVRSRLETCPERVRPRPFAPFLQCSSRDRRHTHLHQLKRKLLRAALEQTPDPGMFKRICGAANQAMDVAWATDEPLLFFPCLFDEMVARTREESLCQQSFTRTLSPLPEPDARQTVACDHPGAEQWPAPVHIQRSE